MLRTTIFVLVLLLVFNYADFLSCEPRSFSLTAPCQGTCQSKPSSFCFKSPGCYCKDGKIWDESEKICVFLEQCSNNKAMISDDGGSGFSQVSLRESTNGGSLFTWLVNLPTSIPEKLIHGTEWIIRSIITIVFKAVTAPVELTKNVIISILSFIKDIIKTICWIIIKLEATNVRIVSEIYNAIKGTVSWGVRIGIRKQVTIGLYAAKIVSWIGKNTNYIARGITDISERGLSLLADVVKSPISLLEFWNFPGIKYAIDFFQHIRDWKIQHIYDDCRRVVRYINSIINENRDAFGPIFRVINRISIGLHFIWHGGLIDDTHLTGIRITIGNFHFFLDPMSNKCPESDTGYQITGENSDDSSEDRNTKGSGTSEEDSSSEGDGSPDNGGSSGGSDMPGDDNVSGDESSGGDDSSPGAMGNSSEGVTEGGNSSDSDSSVTEGGDTKEDTHPGGSATTGDDGTGSGTSGGDSSSDDDMNKTDDSDGSEASKNSSSGGTTGGSESLNGGISSGGDDSSSEAMGNSSEGVTEGGNSSNSDSSGGSAVTGDDGTGSVSGGDSSSDGDMNKVEDSDGSGTSGNSSTGGTAGENESFNGGTSSEGNETGESVGGRGNDSSGESESSGESS